jgi:hypothetical protein
MTCVIALKLRDENGPRLAVQVPLFPEAAFPAGTRSSATCHQATLELADLIKTRIG